MISECPDYSKIPEKRAPASTINFPEMYLFSLSRTGLQFNLY